MFLFFFDNCMDIWSATVQEFGEIAIIVSIIAVITVAVETYYLQKIWKQTSQNQYDETLRKSMGDLYEVYQTDSDVKTKDECELFATRILDILAILAHLNTIQKREDLLEFVKFDLQIAKGIMEWFDVEDLGAKYDEDAKGIWESLNTYFVKQGTKKCKDEALPYCIRNYKDLK